MDYISAATVAILGRGAFSEVSLKRLLPVTTTTINHSNVDNNDTATASTRSLVAVKHIVRQDAILNGRVERIMAEKRCLELLKGVDSLDIPTYCIRLLDTYKNEMTLGFVYEPVFGGSLSQHITLQSRLDDSTAQIYTAEIIAALHHLGSLGIVHRDIKSKNILINSQGHLRLCDFGSAKLLSPIFQSATLTRPGDDYKKCAKDDDDVDDPHIAFAKFSLLNASSKSYSEMQRTVTFIGTEYAMAPELKLLAKKNKSADKSKGVLGYSYPVDYFALGILIEEMIVGNAVLDPNIESVVHLAEVTRLAGPNATSLITLLLEPDPSRRLIAADISAVSSHPFFEGIDWVRIIEGTHRCGDINFDRRIGFMEFEETFCGGGGGRSDPNAAADSKEDCDGEISSEQQLLFDGY